MPVQMARNRLLSMISAAQKTIVVNDINSNDLVLLPSGGYATDPTNHKIWHFTYDGKKTEVVSDIRFPNGIHTSLDQEFLLVTGTRVDSILVSKSIRMARSAIANSTVICIAETWMTTPVRMA